MAIATLSVSPYLSLGHNDDGADQSCANIKHSEEVKVHCAVCDTHKTYWALLVWLLEELQNQPLLMFASSSLLLILRPQSHPLDAIVARTKTSRQKMANK